MQSLAWRNMRQIGRAAAIMVAMVTMTAVTLVACGSDDGAETPAAGVTPTSPASTTSASTTDRAGTFQLESQVTHDVLLTLVVQ